MHTRTRSTPVHEGCELNVRAAAEAGVIKLGPCELNILRVPRTSYLLVHMYYVHGTVMYQTRLLHLVDRSLFWHSGIIHFL